MSLFFQGRGVTYLAERNAEMITGPALPICQDAFSVALSTESFEHINKCGAVDSPDLRAVKSSSGTVTLSYADVADKQFAIGVLGTVNEAGAPGTVTDEVLPAGLVDGDVYFAGGIERHRALTALVITDSTTGGGASVVLDTNYTVDVEHGKITFIDVGSFAQPFVISYGYTDPGSVSFLSAAQKEYHLSFENINKLNANDPGSVECYRVRFDPASLLDFLSDELQILELTGTMLADPAKPVDDVEFGQFGRRIL
jgi:hypothetical protein